MKNIRKVSVLALAVLAMFLMAACGSDDDGKKGSSENKIRRTVVMYVSAQNSLGARQFNRGDSTEIMAGNQFLNSRDQLLLYIDDAQKPRVYRIYRGCKAPQLVRTYSTDVNSSDPAVLQELLEWTMSTYPSESYGLVMWSHSDGWVPSWSKDYSAVTTKSFGLDVGPGGDMNKDTDVNGAYGATMDINDLANAVRQSGMHPRYIFFDSCMMQCIEVDYALRDVTDYVVASPISTPAIGANYTSLIRDGLFRDDPAQIAASYYMYITSLPVSSVYHDFGMVVACVKTSELENLAAVTRRYISQLPAVSTDSEGVQTVNWPNMEGVTQYCNYDWRNFYRPHFYDLCDAMHTMLTEEQYADWKAALDRCVVWHNATDRFYVGENSFGGEIYFSVNAAHSCSVSAFIPQQVYTQNASRCVFGDLNADFSMMEWYEAAGWKDAGW